MESGTIEQTLPGLEAEIPRVAMSTGHAIPLTPKKRLMVFAGRSHPELASKIAEQLGVELGEIELTTFANGETYCRYGESIRGADVFIVQTGSEPIDRNLMELLFMIQAAKLASAKRITAVMPLFPYARQDRKAKPREPISARLSPTCSRWQGRPAPDDGSPRGSDPGLLHDPRRPLTALPLFAQYFRDLGLTGDRVVSVAPDAGRAKHAVRFAEMIGADFAIMHKARPSHDIASVTEITGRSRGRSPSSGHNISSATPCSRARGHSKRRVLATSGSSPPMVCFSGDALERFAEPSWEASWSRTRFRSIHFGAPPDDGAQRVGAPRGERSERLRRRVRLAIFGGENQLSNKGSSA